MGMGMIMKEKVFLLLLSSFLLCSSGNKEGDALFAQRINLIDPNNALQSWDPTNDNPCKWVHVSCEGDSVTRIDLGNSNLSGQLVSNLTMLTNLKVLALYDNKISGKIPPELGKLANHPNLVSLDFTGNCLDLTNNPFGSSNPKIHLGDNNIPSRCG